ncbi:MAG: OmpA-like protein [Pseudomonadota bacterium]|nr:OmpA-like protein [Pseudomonadota bacterium]
MRTAPLVLSTLGAILMAAGAISAHAAVGVFYDPSNAASPTGKTIGYELYRTIGCPGRALLDKPCDVPKDRDGDGDGVVDSKDKCPNTPAGRKVDADGCELDSDGDGIVDGDDKCPTVYAKTADGCPLPVAATPAPLAPVVAAPAPVVVKMTLEGVNFDFDKATLRQEDLAIIDRDVAALEKWGNVNVEVAGHTDSRGSDEYNVDLSQRRAEAVRNYLISKGIAAERLSAKGYGESRPVADNATDEGRFMNRRVELVQIK